MCFVADLNSLQAYRCQYAQLAYMKLEAEDDIIFSVDTAHKSCSVHSHNPQPIHYWNYYLYNRFTLWKNVGVFFLQ